jgi:cytochrome c oxidase subunit 3/cytochrome o ubiquinol oxidase subunit 3
VLRLPPVILNTVFLLSSSGTIVWAHLALKRGRRRQFHLGMWVTILLAALFLFGTGREWRDFIVNKGLLPATNIFGSTFYTLVGFHALHVTVGVIAMLILIGAAIRGHVSRNHAVGVEMVSWYWHMVDAVWVFIFTLVYIIGR